MVSGVEDDGGGGESSDSSSVQCSICFEIVTDNGERSRAKLYCGHEFHLDCIGSAFNSKGTMQCPNCRKIEKGQWRFSNGHRSFPELTREDILRDEDMYDLGYTDMGFGVQWCPFDGVTGASSSFEDGDSPPNAYHELPGHHHTHHHTSALPVPHSCPYFPFYNQFQSSSNSSESVAEGLGFNYNWTGLPARNDASLSHAVLAGNLHYLGWDRHPPSFSASGHAISSGQPPIPSALLRSSREDSDGLTRPGSFPHPVHLGYGSGSRVGSSVVSSMVPPYPSSNPRAHERTNQGIQSYHQHQQSSLTGVQAPMLHNLPHASGPRSLTASVGTVASSSENSNGYFITPPSGSSGRDLQETENPPQSRFYAWERDRFAPYPLVPVDRDSIWWSQFHQAPSRSDPLSRPSSYWHGYGTETTSSQNPSESSHYQPPVNHPSVRMHPFI